MVNGQEGIILPIPPLRLMTLSIWSFMATQRASHQCPSMRKPVQQEWNPSLTKGCDVFLMDPSKPTHSYSPTQMNHLGKSGYLPERTNVVWYQVTKMVRTADPGRGLCNDLMLWVGTWETQTNVYAHSFLFSALFGPLWNYPHHISIQNWSLTTRNGGGKPLLLKSGDSSLLSV